VSFERTLELARELEDIAAQANALTHLGNTYLQMGEVPRSIELQQQALELSAQLNQPTRVHQVALQLCKRDDLRLSSNNVILWMHRICAINNRSVFL